MTNVFNSPRKFSTVIVFFGRVLLNIGCKLLMNSVQCSRKSKEDTADVAIILNKVYSMRLRERERGNIEQAALNRAFKVAVNVITQN